MINGIGQESSQDRDLIRGMEHDRIDATYRTHRVNTRRTVASLIGHGAGAQLGRGRPERHLKATTLS